MCNWPISQKRLENDLLDWSEWEGLSQWIRGILKIKTLKRNTRWAGREKCEEMSPNYVFTKQTSLSFFHSIGNHIIIVIGLFCGMRRSNLSKQPPSQIYISYFLLFSLMLVSSYFFVKVIPSRGAQECFRIIVILRMTRFRKTLKTELEVSVIIQFKLLLHFQSARKN